MIGIATGRTLRKVFSIRFHGRGGQGVVTSAELLSVAAFDDGLHAQAFPTFGSERTGAPVVSFCRIDANPIRMREPIAAPDAVVIGDPTLLHQVDVFGGLADDGYLLVNSSRYLSSLGVGDLAASLPSGHARAVPATELAREHLGRPLPNAALLGGLAALTGLVGIEPIAAAIRERFGDGPVGEGNVAAAEACFEIVAADSEVTRA
jgi:pyruvate ferredoxin oxidoreductase gamma subunit